MEEVPVRELLFEGRPARVASNRAAGAALLVGLVMGATVTALLPARARQAIVTVGASCSIGVDGYPRLMARITFSSRHPSGFFDARDPVIVYAVRAPEAWESPQFGPRPSPLSAQQMARVRRWLDDGARVAAWTVHPANAAREASLELENRYRAETEQLVSVDVLLIDVDDTVETASARTSCPAGRPPPNGDIRLFPS